jgi:HD-GYP domain-containing protein (c-di-GMP phosphodiesterase class II)
MLINHASLLSLTDRLRRKLSYMPIPDHRRKLIYSSILLENNLVTTSEMAMLQAFLSSYDHDTYEHAYRIAGTALEVAYCLDMTQEEAGLVYLSALLHDIGKVIIPSTILQKRGPLDEEEQRVMRLHPQIGQHMLAQAGGVFGRLADIVVAHHERWDGQGYPFGLVGEDIPLAGRILTVVDSFDAMTSARVYQKPQSRAVAYTEVEQCAGSQYDPRVVAAFLSTRDTRIATPFVPWQARSNVSTLSA